ncbi:GH32 C-terminal domain-containing protein [Roseimarinus sediminis]|uniref:GH32 C-terminal domain-containing protein n=1 Tax=Roseimarinus sediminis TaxID=1610899 RepID=UPI003D226430
MKHLYLLILFLLLAASSFSKKKEELQKYNENYRSQYHFSPVLNKMGNPLSVVLIDSVYHLYFQYNPHNLMDAYFNTGHATSKDLLHWKQHELVFEQVEGISDSMHLVPWWGSMQTIDGELSAWMNRWDEGIVKTSGSDGFVWNAEVKTVGTEQFKQCEPYVFWHEPTQKWIMFVYNRPEKSMHIMRSDDGSRWDEINQFNYNYGFPQMIELPVDRKADNTRWVLFTEKGTYIIGQFDGENFELETSVKMLNNGSNTGSTVVFYDKAKQRHVAMLNVQSEQHADMAANGQLTFPAKLALRELNSGIELFVEPLSEITSLFGKEYSWEDEKVYPGLKNNILKRIKGSEFHLKALIENLNSDRFGFLIRSGRNNQGIEVSYNAKKQIITVMNAQIPYEMKGNSIEIELLIDRSMLEVYLDGGRYVFSEAIAPSPEATGYELFTTGGEIMVKWMKVHPLNSVWKQQ